MNILSDLPHWPLPALTFAHEARDILRDVGGARLQESLKWGQPAWRPKTGGTTLRMGWDARRANCLTFYATCSTDLILRLKMRHPNAFDYAPPRAAHHDLAHPLPRGALRDLAEMAFHYKRVLPR